LSFAAQLQPLLYYASSQVERPQHKVAQTR
jgi:hypothetical protein